MNRREFSKLAIASAMTPKIHATSLPSQEAPLKLRTFNYENVKLLPGPLLEQFNQTRDTYFNIPDERMLVGFRKRAGLQAPGMSLDGWYANDVFHAFGQFLAGMSRMSKATGDTAMKDKVNGLIAEWAKTIAPDGYFYYSNKPNAPHYTYEKMMGGLNDAYEYLGNGNAREHAARITSWAMKNLGRERNPGSETNPSGGDGKGGSEWYTLAENLYRFYEFTGDKTYKNFADVWHYTKYWDGYADNKPEVNQLHAYSHVNTLSSAAMAYKVSNDPKYLRTLTNAHAYLQAHEVFATGGYGPGERLLSPNGQLGDSLDKQLRTFEDPCGSWACFKMSRYLMSFTGDANYGDWLEALLYNGIGAALPVREDGATFYYSDYRMSGGSKFYHWQHWPCCSGTYPQAVADYFNTIYFLQNGKGLFVNLYVPSEVTWQPGTSNESAVIRQETKYPREDTIRFTVVRTPEQTYPIAFRIPAWASKDVRLKVNDAAADFPISPGQWATISRKWKSGDTIELLLPAIIRMKAIDAQHPRRFAILRGPEVLVTSAAREPRKADIVEWAGGLQGTPSPRAQQEIRNRFVAYRDLPIAVPYFMYFDA